MPKRETEGEPTLPMESRPKRRVIRRAKKNPGDREKVSFHLYPETIERTFLARRRLGLTRDQFAERALLELAKTVDYSLKNEAKGAIGKSGSEDIAAA